MRVSQYGNALLLGKTIRSQSKAAATGRERGAGKSPKTRERSKGNPFALRRRVAQTTLYGTFSTGQVRLEWWLVLDHIDLPDLSPYSQPSSNDARSVSSAFDAILTANDEASSSAAYHRLLYAIGNDHAGTYHSVALSILPGIERILGDGTVWSRHAALEALIELGGPFKPKHLRTIVAREISCERGGRFGEKCERAPSVYRRLGD